MEPPMYVHSNIGDFIHNNLWPVFNFSPGAKCGPPGMKFPIIGEDPVLVSRFRVEYVYP
jgi:hypothetical protein